jgi:hypothetical protein
MDKNSNDIIETFEGGVQKYKYRSILLIVMIVLFMLIVFID